MVFQILLIVAIVAVAVMMGRSTGDVRHMAYRRLLLLLFVAAAAAAILFPRLLSELAYRLGVGRGTDLLLYATVVAFIGSLAMQSRRASELSQKITLLTRAQAQEQARADELEARLASLAPSAPAPAPAVPVTPAAPVAPPAPTPPADALPTDTPSDATVAPAPATPTATEATTATEAPAAASDQPAQPVTRPSSPLPRRADLR